MKEQIIEIINKITQQNIVRKTDFEKVQRKINRKFESGLISFFEFFELTEYNKKMMNSVYENYILV